MKEIEQVSTTISIITSEPGDMTRYNYLVHKDGYDEFTFAPTTTTFRFPQRLNYWDVKDLLDSSTDSEHRMNEIIEKENCNPYTLRECIRTVIELHNDRH